MTTPALKGPFYDPPYDSPIEDLFAVNAVKYLHEDCQFDKQVEVPTILGTYRLDFLVTRGSRKMAVECDGKEFHDKYRDEWRDALIFDAGGADVIYRLRGCDLTYHTEDLLYLMARWDPEFFSDRAQINLNKLVADEIRPWGNGDDYPMGAMAHYRPEPGQREGYWIDIDRFVRVPPPGKRVFWPYYPKQTREYLAAGFTSLDAMIEHQKTLPIPVISLGGR
jgi:hypothetical protein